MFSVDSDFTQLSLAPVLFCSCSTTSSSLSYSTRLFVQLNSLLNLTLCSTRLFTQFNSLLYSTLTLFTDCCLSLYFSHFAHSYIAVLYFFTRYVHSITEGQWTHTLFSLYFKYQTPTGWRRLRGGRFIKPLVFPYRPPGYVLTPRWTMLNPS